MNFKKIFFSLFIIMFLLSCGKDSNNINIATQGKSGSMARMIVVGNYMYVVDNQNLKTFDISDETNPIETNRIEVGFGIETIFPFANYLFIGSTDGMYIYSITNPDKPIQAASERVQHFTACDPVVANENYAYVTLNSLTTSCGRNSQINELQIVNIQDVFHPYVENVIQLEGPKGLGLDANKLFVCDADLGVKIFDLSLLNAPSLITTISDFTANDLIPDNGNLLVVCSDGLRQFNYSDINNITLTSYLEIND